MKLLSVHCENFRLHADTFIPFPDGITGIIGSNESGKSTIATEALLWAFYGGVAVRGTMDGVRWNKALPRKVAKVTVVFEIGGTTYTVIRSETGASVLEGEKVVAKGQAAVNKFLPTILAMSHDDFVSSFLVKQKDVARIAAMGGTERTAFIRQVMGVGKIDEGLKACRKKKTALSSEMSGMEAGLGLRTPLEEAYQEATDECAAASEKLDGAEQMRDSKAASWAIAEKEYEEVEAERLRHAHFHQELGIAKKEEARLVTEVKLLDDRLLNIARAKGWVADADEKLAKLPGLRESRDRLYKESRLADEKVELLNRQATLSARFDGLNEKITEHQGVIAGFVAGEYGKAVADDQVKNDTLVKLRKERFEERTKLLTQVDTRDAEYSLLTKKIKVIQEAGEDGCCPTCTRELGDTYDLVMDTLSQQLKEAGEFIVDGKTYAALLQSPTKEEAEAEREADESLALVTRLRDLKQKAEVAEAGLTSCQEQTKAVEAEKAPLDLRIMEIGEVNSNGLAVKVNLAAITRLEELQDSDELALSRSEEAAEVLVQGRMKEAEAELVEIAAQVQDRKASLEENPFDVSVHEELYSKAKEARLSAEDARVAVGAAEGALSGWERTLRGRNEALANYDARAVRLKEVQADHLLHERAAGRLADFRVAIAGTIRPELEELMSGFVHLLTDGRHESVELSEDFEVTLFEGGLPIEVISGGTEDISALAMRLALSQMIAQRAGHPLSLLVLDEPFGSLDETRRGNVVNLLRSLGRIFEQIVVISHVAETKDACDHAIQLEFDEALGASRVAA